MLGLKPIKIEVEVDTNRGQPKLVIIGLPSRTVTEAKERLTSAFLNCNIRIKAKRTVVNLAPADLRKSGSGFELAIAAALLKEYGILKQNTDSTMFFGELALSGEIKPIKGVLPLVLAAGKMGFEKVVIPTGNQAEVAHLSSPEIYPVNHFKQLVAYAGGSDLHKILPKIFKKNRCKKLQQINLSDILGQHQAKRALVIAAAGGHNLLMIGPPGVGKSMLAQAAGTLLPPLSKKEATEISVIHSLRSSLPTGLLDTRPIRSPHHTISTTGLIGGGLDLHPGEISLAHHGILFLDEINEFSRTTLEALREPLEKGSITLARSQGSVNYPASFSLIAAANPCPCGFFGSTSKTCTCTPYQVDRYQRRISGPLRDRFDLQVFLDSAPASELIGEPETNSIETTIKGIAKAKILQRNRLRGLKISNNAALNSKMLRKYCTIEKAARQLLNNAADKLGLSARGYFAVLRVAQTIADLEEIEIINSNHIAEALQFRP